MLTTSCSYRYKLQLLDFLQYVYRELKQFTAKRCEQALRAKRGGNYRVLKGFFLFVFDSLWYSTGTFGLGLNLTHLPILS